MWLDSVNEITYQDLIYPNMVLLGIRALATNQLSGSDINVQATIQHGLRSLDENTLPAALQAYEEDNPACVAADMMIDTLYGGGQWPGILPQNIQNRMDEWVDWANLNDELVNDSSGDNIRRHVFNGVFDSEENLWTALQHVCKMSRAALIPIGLDYGVFVDQVDTPVQMFTMGNTLQDSFTETWLDLDARANQVEIQIADETRQYRMDNPVVYMDPADQNAGVIVKNVRIDGKGITNPSQAWHLGNFIGLSNKLQLRTGSFRCDIGAIACRPGNLIILQNDVPQWGQGGRLLSGNTTTVLKVDRNDLPWDGTTAYNVMVLHPSVERYSGTVTSVATDTDSTGLLVGTQLGLSSFDATNRVTRAVVNGLDCRILSSEASSIVIELVPGLTPTTGMSYTLYDTDVLDTAAVSDVTLAPDGHTQIVTLTAPLQTTPMDYAVYLYGIPGAQKIVRVQNVRRASEFRVTVDWADYDPDQYVDQTPVIGETSAINTTNPMVSNLSASESFELETSGSYESYVTLKWTNGPDTNGVVVYAWPEGASSNSNTVVLHTNAVGIGQCTFPVLPGITWNYRVVGFDINQNYAPFSTSPTVTVDVEGVTENLLLNSTFNSGFTYWNTTARSSDTTAIIEADDNTASYTVGGSAITAAQLLFFQSIPASKWAVGDYLMLSAYLAVSGTPTGNFVADICFLNSSGGIISTSRGVVTMAGAAVPLVRVTSPNVQVPTGTVQVLVRLLVDGASFSVSVGTVLECNHLLLEQTSSTQTQPSEWAQMDAAGMITELFTLGSSTGLLPQGSILPAISGTLDYAAASVTGGTNVTISWSSLALLWPDGSKTYIADGSIVVFISGTAPTLLYAFPYYDHHAGAVALGVVGSGVGTIGGSGGPYLASAATDAIGYLASISDGNTPLTPGTTGLTVNTTTSGSGGGSGPSVGSIPVGEVVKTQSATLPSAPSPSITFTDATFLADAGVMGPTTAITDYTVSTAGSSITYTFGDDDEGLNITISYLAT
jgi:hypothetical protein